jgi:hypothetical protein
MALTPGLIRECANTGPGRSTAANDVKGGKVTTDTRIFNSRVETLWHYISMSYRGVRCGIFGTLRDDGMVNHAKFTHTKQILGIQAKE